MSSAHDAATTIHAGWKASLRAVMRRSLLTGASTSTALKWISCLRRMDPFGPNEADCDPAGTPLSRPLSSSLRRSRFLTSLNFYQQCSDPRHIAPSFMTRLHLVDHRQIRRCPVSIRRIVRVSHGKLFRASLGVGSATSVQHPRCSSLMRLFDRIEPLGCLAAVDCPVELFR